MGRVRVMLDERSKTELAIGLRVWRGGRLPNLYCSPEADGEMLSGRRKGECCHRALEGQVMEREAPREVGQYCPAILIDGKEKVSPRSECDPTDVLAMREGERIRFVVDEIEDCDPVPDWRQETGAVRCEEEVALAIDSA